MTKLTLSVDDAVVEKAKRIAEANGTSVSAMFSRFVQSMGDRRGRRGKIGPLTRKASGLVTLPPDRDDKELLTEALMDRHGITE